MITHTSVLAFETFVAPPVPVVTSDLAPGQSLRAWSPITATLISGQRDAVLVDPLMTIEQGRAVADWVAANGKNLTTVYITHGSALAPFGNAIRRFEPSPPWAWSSICGARFRRRYSWHFGSRVSPDRFNGT